MMSYHLARTNLAPNSWVRRVLGRIYSMIQILIAQYLLLSTRILYIKLTYLQSHVLLQLR